MTELGSTAKALVTAARDEAGLTPDERARLRARVLATASAGGASLFGSLLAKVAAAKPLGMSVVTWGALAATVAGAGTVYTLTRPVPTAPAVERPERPAAERPERPAAERPATPANEGVPPSGDTGSGSVSGEPRRRPERSTESTPRVSAPSSTLTAGQGADPGFAEDARLLRDVRAALAAGQGDRALSLLEARETNPASGVFAEEREAAKIVTLCELGRAEARAAAARFLKAHATSPLAERVRRACPR